MKTKQSYIELQMVFQVLRELNRAHPDDTNLFICMVEAERQRDAAWHAQRALH